MKSLRKMLTNGWGTLLIALALLCAVGWGGFQWLRTAFTCRRVQPSIAVQGPRFVAAWRTSVGAADSQR
jgi:hypothetical protein